MTATFAHASPGTALGPAPAERVRRASHAQWVDALVTFAAMAWFSAALVGMAGELHVIPSTPAAQHAGSGVVPPLSPQAATSQDNSGHARMALI